MTPLVAIEPTAIAEDLAALPVVEETALEMDACVEEVVTEQKPVEIIPLTLTALEVAVRTAEENPELTSIVVSCQPIAPDNPNNFEVVYIPANKSFLIGINATSDWLEQPMCEFFYFNVNELRMDGFETEQEAFDSIINMFNICMYSIDMHTRTMGAYDIYKAASNIFDQFNGMVNQGFTAPLTIGYLGNYEVELNPAGLMKLTASEAGEILHEIVHEFMPVDPESQVSIIRNVKSAMKTINEMQSSEFYRQLTPEEIAEFHAKEQQMRQEEFNKMFPGGLTPQFDNQEGAIGVNHEFGGEESVGQVVVDPTLLGDSIDFAEDAGQEVKMEEVPELLLKVGDSMEGIQEVTLGDSSLEPAKYAPVKGVLDQIENTAENASQESIVAAEEESRKLD